MMLPMANARKKDPARRRDIEGLVVFLILLSIILHAEGWARVGYLALAAVLGSFGLWLKWRNADSIARR